ncbi:MAG: SCO family protein [Gammaproteobacteria bacterium]
MSNLMLPGLLAIIVAIGHSGCSSNNHSIPKPLRGVLLEQPVTVNHFQLTTQDGNEFTEENFHNQWTMMFFGYTHCPDICPTTLTELAALAKRLAQEGKPQPQIVFVSVDPQRDTPRHLKEYITYFDEDFLALTGKADRISGLTKQLKIKYSLEPAIDDNYVVNHSSAVLLIDPQGRYVANFKAPHYAETLQAQFDQVKRFINTPANT